MKYENGSIVCYVTHNTWKEGECCLCRRIIYSEDGGSMILENLSIYLAVSHPRRLYECLCMLSREEAAVDYFDAGVHKFRVPGRRRD